jgi:hypothetical protein
MVVINTCPAVAVERRIIEPSHAVTKADRGQQTLHIFMSSIHALSFSVLEHLGSNLDGRCGHGDDRAFCVHELSGEEAYFAAASHDASSPEQASWAGRPQKLDMQVSRRGEVTRTEASNQRGSQRVVQHGGEKAALNDSGWIQERLGSSERNFDRSFLRADGDELPAERDRGCREWRPSFHCIPERAFAFHGHILAGTADNTGLTQLSQRTLMLLPALRFADLSELRCKRRQGSGYTQTSADGSVDDRLRLRHYGGKRRL